MRIFIRTADKHAWALRACFHLMDKYWPEHPDVFLAGYERPDRLPKWVEFFSIGSNSDYPVSRWSTATQISLDRFEDELFIWWMSDFWLVRRVDHWAIEMLAGYMGAHPQVSKIDLTSDRLYAANLEEYDSLESIDLISNQLPSAYISSLQAGMWRRSEMMKYLLPEESPWDFEIDGSRRMNEGRALVLGTRQIPCRYLIAVQQGKLRLDGGYQVPRPPLKVSDIDELRTLGYLNGYA